MAQEPAQPARTQAVPSSITVVEKVSAETPASLAIVGKAELRRIPGVNVDDRLRMIPGFSLFRRSSSLAAHPTTQGISLRGIGTSGASRTLVLWDGIPLNDPFGGWVYWTRVNPEELGRVEVLRGASTSVFGDRALTGAIALFSREPEPRRVTGSYEFGSRNTHAAGAGFSHPWSSKYAISGQGRAFTTNGYYIVPEANRGRVDKEAGVRFAAGDVRFDVLGARQRLFVKTDMLVEERENGTPMQRNSSSMGNAGANWSRDFGKDTVSLLGYHTRAEFRSAFSTILANRATERATLNQSVPADATGGAAYWRHSGSRFNSPIGGDAQRVEGWSIDSLVPTGKRIGGGTVLQHGTFAQADAKLGPVRLFAGARHHFTGQDRQFFSPSLGATAGKGRWRARGSSYRSFRAPTLNELYREFVAGNATTRPNDRLRPESIFGGEGGLDFVAENSRVSFTGFHNSVKDVITNVTLISTPAQIVRQRRNAAEATSRGVEADFRHRRGAWQGELSYLFASSRFTTGLRVPQVPRHQGSAQLTWNGRKTFATAGVRSHALQFEDDLNRLPLPGYATAHITVRHELRRGLSAMAAFENLLNREYWVGFTTLPASGPPRLWRAGLRWDGRLF